MVVAELEKTLSSFPVVDSVVSLLDGVVEKLSALKRKVRNVAILCIRTRPRCLLMTEWFININLCKNNFRFQSFSLCYTITTQAAGILIWSVQYQSSCSVQDSLLFKEINKRGETMRWTQKDPKPFPWCRKGSTGPRSSYRNTRLRPRPVQELSELML